MNEDKRKVVGEGVVITERKYTKMKSKNVHKEIIERNTHKAYILECGHKAYMTRPNAKTMLCWNCLEPESKLWDELR